MNRTKWIVMGVFTIATVGLSVLAADREATVKKGERDHYRDFMEMVAKYDANKDGKLDLSELDAMPADIRDHCCQIRARFDANNDGIVNKAELAELKKSTNKPLPDARNAGARLPAAKNSGKSDPDARN